MAVESVPQSPNGETNPIPHGSWVVITPDGPALARPASRDELATLIARRLRPDVIAVNTHPSEREIRRVLGQYTSERHGAVTKDMQDRIADRLREPEGE